ncbi:Calcium-binding protein OS=Streptomyces glaucescens OX=1907 GN=SGLAU_32875 PE=4 SV=1 [Streptomyces glaucescens]
MTLRKRRLPAARRVVTVLTTAGAALASTLFTAPGAHAADSDITFSNVVINKGKPIVLGTGAQIEVPLTYTVKTKAKLDDWWVSVYRGTLDGSETVLASGWIQWNCRQSAAGGYTYYDCDESLQVDPDQLTGSKKLVNSDATIWKTSGTAIKIGGSYDTDLLSYTTRLKRASVIASADASPEPVTKGKPITVKGTLKRANWNTHRYDLYGAQKVTLQFKAAGTTTYTNVKTISTMTAK